MRLLPVIAVCALLGAEHAAAAGSGAQCAEIEGDAARLACYDGVFRNGSGDATGPSPEITLSAPAQPATTSPETDAESKFGREQIERQQPPKEREGLTEISSDVMDIKRRARNELVVYLTNGQVWVQTSPRYLTIKNGDSVIVRRGRMGGYILTTERGGSTRVKRLR